MKLFKILLLSLSITAAHAQSYNDSIRAFRKKYAAELLEGNRAPLKSAQLGGLNFFKPDRSYSVWATLTITPGSVPFMIETHSGKKKPFRQYGVLTFSIHDTTLSLQVYQGINLIQDDIHKDDLFVPFYDDTNYELTYAGGRYIDLSLKDVKDNKILLDFNKCYNPYCAYTDGYSCPVPPRENRLEMAIMAGEMLFQQ